MAGCAGRLTTFCRADTYGGKNERLTSHFASYQALEAGHGSRQEKVIRIGNTLLAKIPIVARNYLLFLQR